MKIYVCSKHNRVSAETEKCSFMGKLNYVEHVNWPVWLFIVEVSIKLVVKLDYCIQILKVHFFWAIKTLQKCCKFFLKIYGAAELKPKPSPDNVDGLSSKNEKRE